MPAVLQQQRVDQNGDDERKDEPAEKPLRKSREPDDQPRQSAETPKHDAVARPRRRPASAVLGDDKVMIAVGKSFTQFSSPSFRCRIC